MQAYYGNVYDMTHYFHPGAEPLYGQRVIRMDCGQDGTRDYASVHPQDKMKSIKKLKVGWIKSFALRAGTTMSLLFMSVTYVLFL